MKGRFASGAAACGWQREKFGVGGVLRAAGLSEAAQLAGEVGNCDREFRAEEVGEVEEATPGEGGVAAGEAAEGIV